MVVPTAGNDEAMVTLGRVSGVHGVKGWLKVFSYTDPKERIFDYGVWWISRDGSREKRDLIEHLVSGKKLIVRLGACETRNQAERLVDAEIMVPEQLLDELEDGDYYWRQLLGMKVVDQRDELIGLVADVLETGANDVLVVSTKIDEGKSPDRLIPWLMDKVILAVDLEEQKIVVDWQPDW